MSIIPEIIDYLEKFAAAAVIIGLIITPLSPYSTVTNILAIIILSALAVIAYNKIDSHTD